jgi:dihydrolipoamide dehydrogenase
VIGLELGTFFAKLGSRVAVVEFLPQLLTGIEADLVGPVSRGLERMGVEVHLQSKAASHAAKAGPDGLDLLEIQTPQGAKNIPADKILVSVGRAPQTAGLGLDTLGVKTDPKGHILVDKTLRTSIPSIYAIGDVTGQPYLAHKATREGIVAAEAIADTERQHSSEVGIVPWAVFTDPEISFVGETEAQARARKVDVLVGRFPFTASGRAQAVREGEGFIKVLADKATHKLLGVGIVGPHAADLIGEACLALKMGCRLEDVASTVHPHPTLPEVFPEACEVALGRPIHVLAQPAR